MGTIHSYWPSTGTSTHVSLVWDYHRPPLGTCGYNAIVLVWPQCQNTPFAHKTHSLLVICCKSKIFKPQAVAVAVGTSNYWSYGDTPCMHVPIGSHTSIELTAEKSESLEEGSLDDPITPPSPYWPGMGLVWLQHINIPFIHQKSILLVGSGRSKTFNPQSGTVLSRSSDLRESTVSILFSIFPSV